MKGAAAAFVVLLTVFAHPMGPTAPSASQATLGTVSASQPTNASDHNRSRTTWNLAQDVGATGNQIGFNQGAEGVWYFVTSSTTAHDPKLYRFIREFNAPARAYGDAITIPDGFSCWQEADVLPDVCFNFTDHPVTLEAFDVPPHSTDMHPLSDRFAIIGWKSPLNGDVRIRGSFTDIDANCGNGIRWAIDKNETTLRSESLDNGAAQSFNTRVRVHEDDVLYFIVDAKDSDYACDSTALNLTISAAVRAIEQEHDSQR